MVAALVAAELLLHMHWQHHVAELLCSRCSCHRREVLVLLSLNSAVCPHIVRSTALLQVMLRRQMGCFGLVRRCFTLWLVHCFLPLLTVLFGLPVVVCR
jgi:hypothetical protein